MKCNGVNKINSPNRELRLVLVAFGATPPGSAPGGTRAMANMKKLPEKPATVETRRAASVMSIPHARNASMAPVAMMLDTSAAAYGASQRCSEERKSIIESNQIEW